MKQFFKKLDFSKMNISKKALFIGFIACILMFMGFSGMAAAALCTGISPFYLAAPMGFLAIHFYNGEPGNSSRLVNYLFYPVSLLLIGLVARFVF